MHGENVLQASARASRWLEDHRAVILESLQSLLRLPSVTGTEGPAQRQFARLLTSFGLTSEIQVIDEVALYAAEAALPAAHSYAGRPNVVGRLPGVGGGRSLLLVSHIDVVAAGADWRYDPWGATQHEGSIYGRGAVDAKGCLWAATVAAAAVAATAGPLRGDVLVASVVDEETTGNGALALCLDGLRADGVVVLEPTEFQVCYGHQGVLTLHVEVPGTAGHGARRSKANAIVRAAQIVTALEALNEIWIDPLRPDFPPPVVNVARIAGGDDLFIVPDHCVVEGTVRFPPGYAEQVRARVIEASERRWPAPGGEARAVARATVTAAGVSTPPESAVAQATLAAARSVAPAAALEPFPATCDARHFAARDMPTVIFGPGSLSRAHGVDEYIAAEELFAAARALVRLILVWCA